MLNQFRTWTLIAGMACIAVTANADDPEGVVRLNHGASRSSTGVARVSDHAQRPVVRGQSPNSDGEGLAEGNYAEGSYAEGGYSEGGYSEGGYCPTYYGRPGLLNNGRLAGYFAMQNSMYRSRNINSSAQIGMAAQANAQQATQIARCKFGYFIPTGCGGAGCPPFGMYRMVYPVDPAHFDQRDGQVYAAAGYGGPVAVPLAPNVEHTYNYGWGLPSSRLTPISHPLP